MYAGDGPGVTGRRRLVLFLAAALVGGLFVLPASPAGAAALTNVSWTVSNNQVSATSVTYGYSFKTATTTSISSVTFVVSGAGLAGTPTIARNYGIPAGTVGITGQTITYTVSTPISITAGIPIYIEFAGLTNSSTAASYTTVVTTKNGASSIDTATSPAVTLASSNTAVTVTVAKSLTFTLNNTAFELDMDPTLSALADQTSSIGMTIQTNAHSGYTLNVNDSAAGLQSPATGTPTIAKVSSGKGTSLAWPGTPAFGYTVTGTGATIDGAFSASKYAGFVSGAGEQIASRSGATGGSADTITIAARVAIDFTVATGVYSDTLTYTATPNYT